MDNYGMKKPDMGYGSELDVETYKMVHEIKEHMEEKEGGTHMNGVSNNDVATLGLAGAIGYGGFGYGYGAAPFAGTQVGNGLLALQNSRIADHVKDNSCDIAKAELGIINNAQLLAANGEIKAGQRAAVLDNKIDRQTLLLEGKIDSLSNQFYMRELAKADRDKVLDGQTINRLEAKVSAFCCPTPTGCGGATVQSPGIDITQIINAVDSIVATRLSAALGK